MRFSLLLRKLDKIYLIFLCKKGLQKKKSCYNINRSERKCSPNIKTKKKITKKKGEFYESLRTC